MADLFPVDLDLSAAALETPVYVAPHSRTTGVWAPGASTSSCLKRGCKVHTSDWRCTPDSPENHHGATADLQRTPLRVALSTRYRTEAHFAAYALLGPDGIAQQRQPRVTKSGAVWLRPQGYELVLTAFLADWDTPGHVEWTPEMRAAFDELWRSAAGPLATCGVYLSPKGARLVQPLTTPIPVEQGEAQLRTWLASLVDAGVDPSVTVVHDWTRLMRAPFHRRATGLVAAPMVDLSRMVPIDPPAADPALFRRTRKPGVRRVGAVGEFSASVPDGWMPTARAVGVAIRDHVRDGAYRRCYMALAGALLARGCPPEGVPAVVAEAHAVDQSYAGWDALLHDRAEIARGTVARASGGADVLGLPALLKEFPTVASALASSLPDTAPASAAETRVRAQLAAPALAPTPVAEAAAVIARELRDAYGVVLIAAPPGTGKTHAVAEFARSLPPIGARATAGARIAVSAPTHALAQQTAAKLPRSLRIFSPPSLIGPDGQPVCIYAEAARALAAGGQSVGREFCDGRGKSPCELVRTCTARPGMEGDPRANLVTGVHGLVRQLCEYAGAAGRLVVDEPGEILVTESISLDDLDAGRRYLDLFETRYVAKIAPALEAFDAWVRTLGAEDASVPLADAVCVGASAVAPETIALAGIPMDTPAEDLGGAVLAAAGEIEERVPPMLWRAVAQCRPNPALAQLRGQASRVLLLLRRGLGARYSARIDVRSGERAAVLTGTSEDLAAALAHEGPVVILDANAALHAPAIEKHLGVKPRLVEIAVADGAPIERSILATASATRASWMPRGVPDWKTIIPALRSVVAWATARPIRRLGIIAPQVIEAAVMHALQPHEAAHVQAWKRPRKALDAAAALLAPVLAPLASLEVGSGHFFALEGLDFMAGFDATVTLTDPRPNLGVERDKAAHLALDFEGRLDALAAAELQQAHGRLRTVHRTAPGWQLHVGSIVPNGWQGLPVAILRLPNGRPRTSATMTGEELRCAREEAGLGLREMARALGLSDGSLRRYESGERGIPDDVRRGVLALVPGAPETPGKKYIYRGVSGASSVQRLATGVSGAPGATGVSGAPRDLVAPETGRAGQRSAPETAAATLVLAQGGPFRAPAEIEPTDPSDAPFGWPGEPL